MDQIHSSEPHSAILGWLVARRCWFLWVPNWSLPSETSFGPPLGTSLGTALGQEDMVERSGLKLGKLSKTTMIKRPEMFNTRSDDNQCLWKK